MEFHVFAVWDFMSLLKKLQIELCCVTLPWLPPKDLPTARMLNEIVLRATDIGPNGEVISHFDLYRKAMHEFGASTESIDSLLKKVQQGWAVNDAMQEVPSAARDFLKHTFAEIEGADLCRIAAAFTFGREGPTPGRFQLHRRPNGRLKSRRSKDFPILFATTYRARWGYSRSVS
jgi:hypothetical protein